MAERISGIFVHDKKSITITAVVFLSFRPTGEILNFSDLRFLTRVRNDIEIFLSCTEKWNNKLTMPPNEVNIMKDYKKLAFADAISV
jgi:uncharacterized protein YfbU (UPF0304 family)